jgi:hypothetical protein
MGRNAPCAHSGLKSKHCHGRTRTATPPGPTTYSVFVAEPRARVAGMDVEIDIDS